MDTAHPLLDHPFDHPFRDAFEIEFRLDPEAARVVACRTVGLADHGFPELLVLPDDGGDEDDDDGERRDGPGADDHHLHAVRSAQMISLLAIDVLTDGTLDVLPRSEELLGLPVRFWLGEPELVRFGAPDGPGFEEQLTVPVHWVIE